MQSFAVDMNWHQEAIMQNTVLDGQGVGTHRFRSAQRPGELIASLRERWRARGLPYVESTHGDWAIISMREGAVITTVQVRASSRGSEGLSSRWDHAHSKKQPTSTTKADVVETIRRLLPDGVPLIRSIEHQDGATSALTAVAVSTHTPATMTAQLRHQAQYAGFTVSSRMNEHILMLRRRREEVVATVTAHADGSAVVLYWSAQP